MKQTAVVALGVLALGFLAGLCLAPSKAAALPPAAPIRPPPAPSLPADAESLRARLVDAEASVALLRKEIADQDRRRQGLEAQLASGRALPRGQEITGQGRQEAKIEELMARLRAERSLSANVCRDRNRKISDLMNENQKLIDAIQELKSPHEEEALDWKQKLQKRLAESSVHYKFEDVSFKDAKSYLEVQGRVVINVDRQAYEANPKLDETPIQLCSPDEGMSLESALNYLCQAVGCAWELRDETILVTSSRR